MREYICPEKYPTDEGKLSIFLAGTIDNGDSDDWQAEITELLKDYDVDIYNPRRLEWNSDLEQSKDCPEFREQVEWELDALTNAHMIIMYLAPNSKSPISLLELGLYHTHDIVVCCPEGFWRKGNVDIVCERHKIPITDDKDKFFNGIVQYVKQETEIEKEKAPE